MIKISLCMIVKNEEKTLDKCLKSAERISDEIIIVDTGSTDKTKEIAKKYTQKIYDFKWVDDFAKARNYSFSKASKEYIMWLDADDVILEEDIIKIVKLKKQITEDVDMVMMKYNTSFDENNNPTFSYNRERIFKKEKGYIWEGRIHEVVVPSGNIIYSDAAICHKKVSVGNPKRNLNIFNKMIAENHTFSAREQYYYARELYYNKEYVKSIEEFRSFLDSNKGWKENNIEACLNMANCYKALESKEKYLMVLLESFKYDTPRAEVCVEIGKHFFDLEEYQKAIFWYKIAVECKLNDISGGFIAIDSYKYIPYIQLCVCYYRLGDIKKSIYYNKKAGEEKPNGKEYLFNKNYFEKVDNEVTL
ncbi:MAG: glycosyltransferase family 2 protein [Clostridia bacterium]|nr:glycosyltransferase family 2 protein [Clostridia bacterium]